MTPYLKRIAMIITALVLAVSVVSCAGDEPTGPAPATPEPTVDSAPVPPDYEAPCDAEFPRPLGFVHETDAEVAASSGLYGCASDDGTQTRIINNSKYVWIAPNFEWPDEALSLEALSLEAQAFRDAVAAEMIGLAMEPGAHAVFDVAPETLYLTVSEQALGAWNAVLLASSFAEDRLTSAVIVTLSGNSKIRAALGECAASGYSAAKYVSEAGNAKTAFERYLAELGLTSGVASCARAVDEYFVESRSTTAPRMSTVDDLLSHSRAPAFVTATMDPLHNSSLARLAIQAKKFLVLIPR